MNKRNIYKIINITFCLAMFFILIIENLNFISDYIIPPVLSQQENIERTWQYSCPPDQQSAAPSEAASAYPSEAASAYPSEAASAHPSEAASAPPSDAAKDFKCPGIGGEQANYQPGQTLTITCSHQLSGNVAFSHYNYKITVPDGKQLVTTQRQGSINFTIPEQYGTYLIQCQACATEGNPPCTDWGQEFGWQPVNDG